ncbi:squalene-hopene/tetraprenyl-beta-curcumene cyclase [Sphingomonas sp. BE270]|jgi:squalene-hopene/tetraprenyl-beta-curcumene cyclase|nr:MULTISPECIES: squalene--hopene cyclase [unclassified Sphingomonas]MDR6849338.1 squalene-hopene/tetraprenyl-beta-curcumene cyclase [Sphingomonas sp. BE137]MDR7257440.1 squalene-hopene/tetraprenyl-beta-curcumene cyclase [Sphingomonas sp. BE270]
MSIDTIDRSALLDEADATASKAAAALGGLQNADGHWVFELEADATIPAEYVLLRHYLGEPRDAEIERKIGVYLRRIQSPTHHGWGLFHGGAFDVSASVKAYFALKMIGDSIDAPHMVQARTAIHKAGGAAAANVFTRIQLALFGAGPWSAVPTLPVELILLPRWFPVHLSKMSYWARTVIVPLLVLAAKKPVARNPSGVLVDELYTTKRAKLVSKAAGTKQAWTTFFNGLDVVLKGVEPLWPKGTRQRAIDACVTFVTERLNGVDGLGAIYPAMANSVMMFDCLGYPEDHPARALARESVEKLLVVKDDEAYCQPCVSPVWDTALASHAMLEVGGEEAEARAAAGLAWLKPLQVLDVKGDWADEKPDVRPGGWAFQYNNAHYPDLDDTAVVVMAMDRAKDRAPAVYDESIARGVEWTVGLQSKDGGWGAFDADNSYHYLNNIPFADHGALLDPPTSDVTARVVSMLAQLGETDTPRMKAALAFLEKEQMPDGSWFGRWGVNYIYGTWSVLCALNAVGLDAKHPMVRKGADWLIHIQNLDGGWGEDCESYALDYKGYTPAPSTASQTGWALLALMAAGKVDHPAVERGIRHLIATQAADGLWGQEKYTGGGFPRVFYLRYHGYPAYFPLWAVARYRNLKRSNDPRPAFGM